MNTCVRSGALGLRWGCVMVVRGGTLETDCDTVFRSHFGSKGEKQRDEASPRRNLRIEKSPANRERNRRRG
jgi:hypothetical protein